MKLREVTDARSALEVYDCALFCAEKVGDKVNEIGNVDDTEVEDSPPPPPIAKSALEAHVPGSLLAFGDDKTATVYALALTPYALQHPESQCTVRALVKPTRTEPWSLYAPTLLEIAGVETKEDRPEEDDLVRALAASAVGEKRAAQLLAPAMELLLPGRVEATIGSGEAGAVQSKQTTTAMRALEAADGEVPGGGVGDPYHQVLSGPASAQLLWGPGGLSCDGNPAETAEEKSSSCAEIGFRREACCAKKECGFFQFCFALEEMPKGSSKPRDVCHPTEEAVKEKGLGAVTWGDLHQYVDPLTSLPMPPDTVVEDSGPPAPPGIVEKDVDPSIHPLDARYPSPSPPPSPPPPSPPAKQSSSAGRRRGVLRRRCRRRATPTRRFYEAMLLGSQVMPMFLEMSDDRADGQRAAAARSRRRSSGAATRNANGSGAVSNRRAASP